MTASLLDFISAELLELLRQQVFFTSLLFIPVLALSYPLKDKHPIILFILWNLVLLRLVIPPELASPISAREFLNTLIPSSVNPSDIPEINGSILRSKSEPAITIFPIILTWNSLYVATWLVVTIVLLSRYIYLRRSYKPLIKHGEVIENSKLLDIRDFWLMHFNIRRQVKLVATTKAISPFTVGTLKPVIVIPQSLLDKLPDKEIKAIIAHEVAHVKRYDDLWIQLQQWLQCLFFFAPVVWLCNSQINRLRELVVDRNILSSSHISSLNYGRAMLAVLKLNEAKESVNTKKLPIAGFVTARQFYDLRFKALGQAKNYKEKHLLEFLLIGIGLLLLLPMSSTPQSIEAERRHIYKLSDTMIPTGNFKFSPPVQEGCISSPHGIREINLGGIKIEEMHMGIDINARVGSPVQAIGPGVVEIASDNPSDGILFFDGIFVLIRHDNGIKSLLGPLYNLQIQKGVHVRAGQLLGYLDKSSSTSSPQPHIHLEVSHKNILIDPEKVMDLTGVTGSCQ